MPTLYILSGLPFSGKSTFAKKAEEMTSLKKVSFDDLWTLLVTDDENMTYERAIREIERLISNNLETGVSVVYDSTNLKKEHRRVFIDLAKSVGVKWVTVYFSIPEAEMRNRQSNSLLDKSHRVIGEESIQAALEHDGVPEDCIIISNEEDKEKLLHEMIAQFPRIN